MSITASFLLIIHNRVQNVWVCAMVEKLEHVPPGEYPLNPHELIVSLISKEQGRCHETRCICTLQILLSALNRNGISIV